MASDRDSNFKSAIEWPEDRPERPEEDHAFEWLALGVARFVDIAAHAFQLATETESPIETILGAELASTLETAATNIDFAIHRAGAEVEYAKPTLLLVPQYVLRPYRYDFALKFSDEDKPRVLIECDGKEFHSSDEQIANDHKKDAAAIAAAVPLLRFSGSLIHRRPKACVEEIMQVLMRRRPTQNGEGV